MTLQEALCILSNWGYNILIDYEGNGEEVHMAMVAEEYLDMKRPLDDVSCLIYSDAKALDETKYDLILNRHSAILYEENQGNKYIFINA